MQADIPINIDVEIIDDPIEKPPTPKWTEKHGYKTTDGYIKMLKRTGKIGGAGYQKWVEAGRPMNSEKVGFRYEDW